MESSRHRIAIAAAFSLFAAPELAAGTDASFVTFESGHVRPLALSPSKGLLFAVNTPDNRLEVFRVSTEGLERAGEVVVGLEPVAVSARSETEVFVVNHLSDSVSVVDVSNPAAPFIQRTLLVGDEPRDLVIAGPGRDKVFITTAHRGQNRPGDPQLSTPGVGRADVWVFDAANLSAAPVLLTLFCDTPRGLAVNADGTRVYAAAFHSGNRTTALDELAVRSDPAINAVIKDGFSAPGLPPPFVNVEGIAAPSQALIVKFDGSRWLDIAGRDWTKRVRFNLPDKDVFEIDASASPPTILRSVSGVGTILFNLAVNPATGAVYVSNLDSQNHVRFEPVVRGHIAESRVTIINGTSVTSVHLNPHINYAQPFGDATEIDRSLAFPLGLEFTQDGSTLYAAAFGSRRIAVLNAQGAVTSQIEVGGGPSGLALDEARRRLYVMNRFDQTISIVDTQARSQGTVVPLRYDPEPAVVREGRPVLYDARRSGHGDSACASCHIFADFDSLAWDLGNPAGQVEANPIERVAAQPGGPLGDFHPMKGPMTTQSLRGMKGAGAMHWRGDRNGGVVSPYSEEEAFVAFRPAFQGLLGMDNALPESEMAKFRDFILTVKYPPNPVANLDSTLTTEQAAGKEIFDSNGSRAGLGGDGLACATCHALPLGTDGHGTSEGLTQDFKVAHLRNLYQKVGMFGTAVPHIAKDGPLTLETTPMPSLGDQVRGFGFLHDGTVPTLQNFFRFPLGQFTFLDAPGRTGQQKVRELEAFMLTFPTGLAPCVGQQVTIDPAHGSPPSAAIDRYRLLRVRAEAGDCELVAHGPLSSAAAGAVRGLFYKGGLLFDSDKQGETYTEAQLLEAISAHGAVITFTAVPPGCGRRIALDRDEDGWLDRDEIDVGSDPANPLSVPGSPFLRGDCNADTKLDISDPIFALGFLFTGGSAPLCPDACNANSDTAWDISDAVYTLLYLFGNGTPPGSYPACERAAGACPGNAACQ